jgi:hypothetical protein
MVELSKKILIKVSFDQYLFQKELRKAVNWIKDSEELSAFREWCILEFGHLYPGIIKKVFN